MERVTGFFKKVISIITRPEMRILPGQLAFFFVLSIIPLIALIGAIASRISIPTEALEQYLLSALPGTVADLFANAITRDSMNFNILIFFFSAFLLASNGTHSMIITSNEIYKIKSDDMIKRRLKAIGMTFILVGIFLFLILVPVCGDTIFDIIKEISTNEGVVSFIYGIYQIVKYPITLIVIYLNIKLLYILAPDKKIRSKTTTKGALFTTISWTLATEIYTFYIGTFSKYDVFYGSISNIVILLLWIYILSYIFVLGMAINAGNTTENDIERTGMLLTKTSRIELEDLKKELHK